MSRPSKEVVDRAVEHYYEDSQCAIERSCAGILAAEVLALREELAQQKAKYKRDLSNHSCNSGGGPDMCGGCCECMERQFEHGAEKHDDKVQKLEAAIARVEALPAKWLAKRGVDTGTLTNAEQALIGFTFRDCAAELLEALKGEP